MLEAGREARGKAPRRSDSVAGEKTTKVDDVEDVGQVLPIDLEAYLYPIRLVNIGTGGRIYLE
jgi:hypothetical protein